MDSEEIKAQLEMRIRENPTQAAWISLGIGFLLARLPLRYLVGGLLVLIVRMLKPAILVYGLLRMAEDCREGRCCCFWKPSR